MRKLLLVLVLILNLFCFSALALEGRSGRLAAMSVAAPINEELIAMLPPSDLVATLDVNRMFSELLPKMTDLSAGGIDRMAKGLADFKLKTGIDPATIQGAVLGANLSGVEASGVILLQGIEVDSKLVDAGMKAYKAEYKTMEYKGKTLYNITLKTPAPSIGPFSLKTDELAMVLLGNQRVAIGDLILVKAVIDNQSGPAKNGINPEIGRALNETRTSALVRFAANLPAELRSQLNDQGDLFASIAGIKMISGTFDAAGDLSLSLEMAMRTASQTAAAELENSLKGLLVLVKGIFGGGDPKGDWIAQLLDKITIGSKLSDVSLSVSLPRGVLDQMSKKPVPAEKK